MQKYTTPDLPYAHDALEPYIDQTTMEIHHGKHHVGYTTKLNTAVESHPELFSKTPEELLADLDNLPEDIRLAVRNNGGGHVHHNFFWEIMRPAQENNVAIGNLAKAIDETFGSFAKFKEELTQAALTVFGSGWAWLLIEDNKLKITKTANQDSPYSLGQSPVLCIDVWEHAYYLKYKNVRPDYIENFWQIINWDKTEELYNK
ncbi:superoxide dismutase [bacterium]|jgi:superoxide dismutase, Fe-Mn family|nr:superoxide dismutase [bacterium]MBT4649266.1 superoxide dismutase [bacterium]